MKRPIVEIAPGTWLLSDYKLANLYLLEGKEKALLIDTGSGLGPLEEEVKGLTDKPLIIALTHGHEDHTGSCHLFSEPSHLHQKDISLLKEAGTVMGMTGRQFRESYVKTRGKVRNPQASEEELLSLIREDGEAEYLPMEDGERFELGDRTIEVLHTPGHSLGSVCFLDSKERLLFTGDTANDCLLLNMWPYTTSVKEYSDSLSKLWSREKEYDFICLGHDSLDKADKTFIRDYLEAVDMILKGEIKEEQINDGIHTGLGFYYKKIRIFYDPEHLLP